MRLALVHIWRDFLQVTSQTTVRSSRFCGGGGGSKELDCGCPQGLRVDPLGWRLLFKTFLRLYWPPKVGVIAYADDVTLLIESDKLKELQKTAVKCGDLMASWADAYEMSFSTAKSTAVPLKGNPVQDPLVVLTGMKVPVLDQGKYLGVTISKACWFDAHIGVACDRAFTVYHHIASVARCNWGISFSTAQRTYRATMEAIVTYYLSVFAHRTSFVNARGCLRRAQQLALLGMCRAYRTT